MTTPPRHAESYPPRTHSLLVSLGALLVGVAGTIVFYTTSGWKDAVVPTEAAAAPRITELEERVSTLQEALDAAQREKTELLADRKAIPSIDRDPDAMRRAGDALAWLKRIAPERFDSLTIRDLAWMRELDLSGLAVTAEDLRHLRTLPGLARLDLKGCGITDTELAALSELTELKELDASGALITDSGLAHLRGLTHLQNLQLGNTSIGDEGLAKLLHLGSLKNLGLTGTKVTDDGLLSLRGLPIEFLELGNTQVGDRGLAVIENFELKDLSLYRMTKLTDEGLRPVANQAKLRKLNLRGANVTAKGLAHIRDLKSVVELNASLIMDDDAMAHLASMTGLERLMLYSNKKITDAGMIHLQNLEGVEHLSLQFTGITDASLGYLAKMRGLRFLDIRGNAITPSAYQAFVSNRPRCKVYR